MVLKGVNWVHIDKIRSNGLERNQLDTQYKKTRQYSVERSQFGTLTKLGQMIYMFFKLLPFLTRQAVVCVCVSVHLYHLYSAPPQTYDRIRNSLQYSLVQGLSAFHSCMRSHVVCHDKRNALQVDTQNYLMSGTYNKSGYHVLQLNIL